MTPYTPKRFDEARRRRLGSHGLVNDSVVALRQIDASPVVKYNVINGGCVLAAN